MLLKFGFPPISASKGLMNDWTNCFTRLLNCAPITTATARSTRFPRRMKFLKPLMRPGFPLYRRVIRPRPGGPRALRGRTARSRVAAREGPGRADGRLTRARLLDGRSRSAAAAGTGHEQGADHGEQDERGRPERQRESGAEPWRPVAPGHDAAPGRHVNGLDEAVAVHGQGDGPAVAGTPDGGPPGCGGHRADDPDAMRGEDRSRGRGGRGAGDPPHRRPPGRPAGHFLEAEGAAGEVIHEHRERAVAP